MDQTDNVLAVARMQEYITAHLEEHITLAQLARAAGYSQWYAAKIFHSLTGLAPYQYIRALRLTGAARKLKAGGGKILDVALDFVFDSQEGFTRAFSKEFGISPYRYQQNPPPIPYFIPYDVRDAYLIRQKGEDNNMTQSQKTSFIFTQVMQRPARNAIILRGKTADAYFAYCEEVGCDIWGLLESVKEALYEPAGFWLPQQLIKAGTSRYVQGVEVPSDYSGVVPKGCDLIALPPCSILVFQGPPYDDRYFEQAIMDVSQAIQTFDPALYGYEWDETAPRFQLAPQGYRGYIEAWPVKPRTK